MAVPVRAGAGVVISCEAGSTSQVGLGDSLGRAGLGLEVTAGGGGTGSGAGVRAGCGPALGFRRGYVWCR